METSALPTAAELRDELRSRIFRHYAPTAARVLGLELQPFSLWHWRTLDLLQSPFAPDSLAESWTDEDVAIAARLCALAPFSARVFDLGRLERLRLIYRTKRHAKDMVHHANTLSEHVTASLLGPVKWQRAGGVPVRCPGWLYLVAGLVSAGWSERAAWHKTPGEARCLLGAIDVVKGGSDFMDEQEALTALDAGHTREDIGLV